MLRSGVHLPLRLIRDTAPVQRRIPSLIPAVNSQWQRPFSTTEPLEKRKGPIIRQVAKLKKKKRYANPQAKRLSEARQRKNVARQAVLRDERVLAYGDKVHGQAEPTEFVKSFDTALDGGGDAETAGETTITTTAPAKSRLLNAFIKADELHENLSISRQMTAPRPNERAGAGDPELEEGRQQRHEAEHGTASEALNRILAVDQASSKQRKHINIQRCIEKLGRHNTDALLAAPQSNDNPGAATNAQNTTNEALGADATVEEGRQLDVAQRIGPDTGSSEVQIAILTMKIRKLAQDREGPLRRDKINKRNLRILLHKRQKLLKYFYKKNRGGARWQHLVEILGLTDATWRDEINLA